VYGPAYVGFDVEAFVRSQKGYSRVTPKRWTNNLTGAQIVQLVADRYSVGPRVLLALLEYQGHWLSDQHPIGSLSCSRWLWRSELQRARQAIGSRADFLNDGYYGYKGRGYTTVRFQMERARCLPRD